MVRFLRFSTDMVSNTLMSQPKAKDLRQRCIEHCGAKFNDPDKGEKLFNAVIEARELLDRFANELGFCPCCDQSVDDVKTDYTDATSVHALYKLLKWCIRHQCHEFKSSDVKHLLDHTQYANLNHLDRFGGIVYRPKNPKTGKQYKSTYYGINIQRAEEFFRNERPAPVQIITKRLTGERIASTEKLLRDFPSIGEFLDADGNYNPKHIVSDDDSIKTKGIPTVAEVRQYKEQS